MFGKDNGIAVVLSELKNSREQMDLKNLRDYLCIRANRVDVLEDVDESLHRPLAIFY